MDTPAELNATMAAILRHAWITGNSNKAAGGHNQIPAAVKSHKSKVQVSVTLFPPAT